MPAAGRGRGARPDPFSGAARPSRMLASAARQPCVSGSPRWPMRRWSLGSSVKSSSARRRRPAIPSGRRFPEVGQSLGQRVCSAVVIMASNVSAISPIEGARREDEGRPRLRPRRSRRTERARRRSRTGQRRRRLPHPRGNPTRSASSVRLEGTPRRAGACLRTPHLVIVELVHEHVARPAKTASAGPRGGSWSVPWM